MDDIPRDTTSTSSERPAAPRDSATHRTVGPESEVRGGPEAVDETLDQSSPAARRAPR